MTSTLRPASGAADPIGDRTTPRTIDARVERLNRVSRQRFVDPDDELRGSVGDGQLIADELLTILVTGIRLDAEQRRRLSREEVAAMFDSGIRFEAVLEAGFAMRVAYASDVTDPRITYLLHEMGEETRHQRLFQRVIAQIGPTAPDVLAGSRILRQVDKVFTRWIVEHPPLLFVMVLAGEEIPDLLQRLASEHPATDPFLVEVNRYHRQEEARHLSFARSVLPEVWADAAPQERAAVHRLAPFAITQLFDLLVQPGVYATVGLDPFATWRAVRASPERIDLRRRATRPVLDALLAGGGRTGTGSTGLAGPLWRRSSRGRRDLSRCCCDGRRTADGEVGTFGPVDRERTADRVVVVATIGDGAWTQRSVATQRSATRPA